MEAKPEILKKELYQKLLDKNAFWSYDMSGQESIPDRILIIKTFIELDIDDINKLFGIFKKEFIKKVWKEDLIPQEGFYYSLNRFIAWFYFGIKKPDKYLKTIITQYYNKLAQ